MKILLVYSGYVMNFSFEKHQAFIFDQIEAVKHNYPNLEFIHFVITGKGWLGYIKSYIKLIKKIISTKPSLIHAHYGLSGFIASLTLFKPLIITFHGSDINIASIRRLSAIGAKCASHSIYVSEKLRVISGNRRKSTAVIPCGVDFSVFFNEDKLLIREKLGMDRDKKYILFASAFDNKVKNYPLASDAIVKSKKEIIVIELKNKSRSEVCELLNASDLLLLTSFSEGSPQVIKEAMACNCPIVATDVGDIKDVIGDTETCFITGFDVNEIALRIKQVIEAGTRTNGREKINHFDNNLIASRILDVYDSVLKKKKNDSRNSKL